MALRSSQQASNPRNSRMRQIKTSLFAPTKERKQSNEFQPEDEVTVSECFSVDENAPASTKHATPPATLEQRSHVCRNQIRRWLFRTLAVWRPPTHELRSEEFTELLNNFTLGRRTETFFTNLQKFCECKERAEALYKTTVRSSVRILRLPMYRSFAPSTPLVQKGLSSVKQVREDARIKKPVFDGLLRRMLEDLGMDPDEEVFRKGSDSYKVLRLADIKKESRCITKTANEYDGNAARLCDVGRATIVCKTEKQVARVYRALKRKTDVVRNKNRFVKPTDTGVRDMMVNISVEDHIFEVQIHQADLLKQNIKSGAHECYEFFRITFAGNRRAYTKRMKVFMKLGVDVQTDKNVARVILEGRDKIKLRYLGDLSSDRMFDTPDLNLLVWKRLLEISKNSSDAKRIDLVTKMGYAYYRHANYERAMELYEQALSDAENSTGCFPIETSPILNNMALVLYRQGKYEEALKIHDRILGGDKSMSMSVVRTYRLMNTLALKYSKQLDYDGAMKVFDRILHGKEFLSVFVSADPSALKAMNNMADVYVMEGKYEQAIDIYEHVLKIRENILDSNDPDTLETVNSLAHAKSMQKCREDTMAAYEQVLERKQKRLGIDHPQTWKTENDIADLHSMQRKYEKAIGIYEKVFERRKAVLGIDHPDTMTTMNNMAQAYSKQGIDSKAVELYKEVLVGRVTVLGVGHPNTLVTMHNLARLYSAQGKHEWALAIYETMLSAKKPTLGVDQQERLAAMRNRALVYLKQENFAEAVKIYETMITRKRINSFRENHLEAVEGVQLDPPFEERISLVK